MNILIVIVYVSRRAKSDGSSDEDSDTCFDPEANPLTVEITSATQTVSVATQMSPLGNKWHRDYCKTLKLSSENIVCCHQKSYF